MNVLALALFVVVLVAANYAVGLAVAHRQERRRIAQYEHGKRLASRARVSGSLTLLQRYEDAGRRARRDVLVAFESTAVRPDVTHIDGNSDEEIVGYLVDGRFHRGSRA